MDLINFDIEYESDTPNWAKYPPKNTKSPFNDTHEPILTYPHKYEEEIGCSVTGGAVYDGEKYKNWNDT